MGYLVHIFRRSNWDDDSEESSISLDEWLKYVQTDKELKLTNGYRDIFKEWQEEPGFCVWVAHPSKFEDEKPWFDFHKGTINAKYPDDYTIRKMVDISIALDARVQGDD